MSGARIARGSLCQGKDDRRRTLRGEISEVPERFRDQVRTGKQGSDPARIDDMRAGPNYDRMSPSLAANIRRQRTIAGDVKSIRPVESIVFRGVGPAVNIYGVKFCQWIRRSFGLCWRRTES